MRTKFFGNDFRFIVFLNAYGVVVSGQLGQDESFRYKNCGFVHPRMFRINKSMFEINLIEKYASICTYDHHSLFTFEHSYQFNFKLTENQNVTKMSTNSVELGTRAGGFAHFLHSVNVKLIAK